MITVERVVVEGQGTFVRVRKPAYWLYVVLVGFGLVSLGSMMSDAVTALSSALWIAALLNGALAAVFVLILSRMDLFEREPAAVRAAAFIWGAVVATSVAIIANNNLLALMTKLFGTGFAARWGAALAGPTNEEWLKTLGVIILVLIVKEHFNRSIDGLTYGAMCGLGFQVTENMVYAINNAYSNPNSDVAGAVSVTVIRILVAGPWSHPIYSGVAGLGIAYAVTTKGMRSPLRRYGIAVGLFIAAWLMHALWNSPLPDGMPNGVGALAVYGKGALILIFFFVLYRYAARYEWHWFERIMTGQSAEVITETEMASMRTLRTRRKARKQADFEYGPKGRKLVARMQRAHLMLGEALARAKRAEVDPNNALDVVVARQNVLAVRAELDAARRLGRKPRKRKRDPART
ncbi:PrsW family intramembrane metalloprotease [Stackebrandtia nassauensis]|uniref:Membrane protein-like protein n=1 Tax=Stackebrandtia nassauensis (strain DSM 44728 / CIP 108903 / NRRL B-16338 / NBRC 102104 / LLR-40K-21) TaxID=446470 RepID=D3Q2J4_STANL|nr:PrsW family intramembrane metalloprotease [Stackebrandtia nassauensis]ADD43927.1 membrane protein-like protein [Stackebrandtia nassauensis DSM 44728]